MNEEIPVSHLVWRCSDFPEHVDAIIDKVNQKVTVTFDGDWLNSTAVVIEMHKDNAELVNDMLTDMPAISITQSEAFDSKLQELAEEAARSYKGQYDA